VSICRGPRGTWARVARRARDRTWTVSVRSIAARASPWPCRWTPHQVYRARTMDRPGRTRPSRNRRGWMEESVRRQARPVVGDACPVGMRASTDGGPGPRVVDVDRRRSHVLARCPCLPSLVDLSRVGGVNGMACDRAGGDRRRSSRAFTYGDGRVRGPRRGLVATFAAVVAVTAPVAWRRRDRVPRVAARSGS
jgi:hypothetical protein